MNPWVLVLIVVMSAVVYMIWRMSSVSSAPEPKRFGLNEAEAALEFVRNGGAVVAQSILGVVVGVLGYQNTVADDVQEEIGNLGVDIDRRNAKVDENDQKIAALRAEIERLMATSDRADERITQLRKIAEVFRG